MMKSVLEWLVKISKFKGGPGVSITDVTYLIHSLIDFIFDYSRLWNCCFQDAGSREFTLYQCCSYNENFRKGPTKISRDILVGSAISSATLIDDGRSFERKIVSGGLQKRENMEDSEL